MEEREQFSNKEESVLNLGELQDRFDAEFEEYKNGRKESAKKDFEKNSKPGEAESVIKNIESELNGLNVESKIIKILNNFHFWFPGGYYRKLKLDDYEKAKDKNRFEYNKKIAEDLDEAIKECGYSSEAEIIGNKGNIDKNIKTKVLVEIYFKMKDKGYSNRELAT